MNDEGEQEGSDSPGWFVISLIVIVAVAIALVILAVIGLLGSLIVWAIIEVVTDHDNAFRVIGENAVPFGAWAAAIVDSRQWRSWPRPTGRERVKRYGTTSASSCNGLSRTSTRMMTSCQDCLRLRSSNSLLKHRRSSSIRRTKSWRPRCTPGSWRSWRRSSRKGTGKEGGAAGKEGRDGR